MTQEAVRTQIVEIGIIPAVRTSSADDARFAAETIARAGIPIVEITMTVPHALDIIQDLAQHVSRSRPGSCKIHAAPGRSQHSGRADADRGDGSHSRRR